MATAVAQAQLTVAASTAALKSSFVGTNRTTSSVSPVSNGSRVCMRASSSWLPGEPRPAYLDGSAPADYGFDPLKLGEVPSNLERFKEAELIHCRWAMMSIPGILIPEALGLGNWVEAQQWAANVDGQATYLGQPVPWGTLPVVLAVETLAVAFVEAQRNMETDPEKRKYPGGPFDPLGFAKNPSKLDELKTKELNNGRLALVAFLGFCIQAAVYPGTGPLGNLGAHLADPLHANIADVIIPRGVY